jgi:hypothetical protein
MNDAWGYDDTNESGDNTAPETPKALRDAYAALKKQNEDLISSLNADRAERAKEKLSSVFSELGVPGAADLYTGEPDPEKARAWAESMRAAFGSGNAQGAPDPVDVPPVLDNETQRQFQAMSQAGHNGTPMGNFQAAESAVSTANDLQSLISAMANANHQNG